MNKRSSSVKSSNFAGVVIGSSGTGRRYTVVVVVVVICLLLLAGILAWHLSSASTSQCNGSTNSAIYRELSPLASTDTASVGDEELVSRVEKDKGYHSDINCLYPLINHYILAKDEAKVKELFGLFESHYGNDKKSQRLYKDYGVRTYDDVKVRVDEFLEGDKSVDTIYF